MLPVELFLVVMTQKGIVACRKTLPRDNNFCCWPTKCSWHLLMVTRRLKGKTREHHVAQVVISKIEKQVKDASDICFANGPY